MNRTAIWIASVGFSASVAGAVDFALHPGDADGIAALLVLAGQIIAAATAVVGIVLVRAPWGRWALLSTTALSMVLSAAAGSGAFSAILIVGAFAVVGVAGPWLRLWLRHHRAADAPGPIVVTLIAVAPTATLFIGLVTLAAASPIHVVLAFVTVASSLAYGRGVRLGLWSLRVAVPVLAALSVDAASGLGAVLLAVGTGTITVAAWLPHAKRATAVITPPLPAPHRRRTDADQ